MSENPSPGPGEVGAEAPQNVDNTPAQLSITDTVRSDERVVTREELTDPGKAQVRIVGNEAVVIRQGGTTIDMYNDRGEKITRDGADTMIADWEQIPARADGISWQVVKSLEDVKSPYSKILDNIPISIRPKAEQLLKSASEATIPRHSWKIDTANPQSVVTDVDDDVVIISMPGTGTEPGTDTFIAYQRTDGSGNQRSASNWQRVDTLAAGNVNTLHPNIRARMDALHSADTRGTNVLGNNNTVTVTENAIVIRDQSGQEKYRDSIRAVGNNIAEDPQHPGVFYYTSAESGLITRIDTNADPVNPESDSLQEQYAGIHNLRIDTTGSFVSFATEDNKFIILDLETRDKLGEVENIYHADMTVPADKSKPATITGFDEQGHLITHQTDTEALQVAIQQRKLAEQQAAATGLDDLADEEARKAAEDEKFKHLHPARDSMNAQLEQSVGRITDLDGFAQARTNLDTYLDQLSLSAEDRGYLQRAGEAVITDRETTLATEQANTLMSSLDTILETTLTVDTHTQCSAAIAELRNLAARGIITDKELRQRIQVVEDTFVEKQREYIQNRAADIATSTRDVVEQAKAALGELRSTGALRSWRDQGEEAALRIQLRQLEEELTDPTTGKVDNDIKQIIIGAQRQLLQEVEQRRKALEDQEKITGDSPTDILRGEVAFFNEKIDALLAELDGLEGRTQVYGSLGYQELLDEIVAFRDVDLDEANVLRRRLGNEVAMIIAGQDMQAHAGVDGAGRQLIEMGGETLPVWQDEAEHFKDRRTVKLDWKKRGDQTRVRDDGTEVPMGDIHVLISDQKKDKTEVINRRLFQGFDDEDVWSNSILDYRDEEVPSTYIDAKDFKAVKKKFGEWERGTLKAEDAEKKKAIEAIYDTRPVQLADGREVTFKEAQELLAEHRLTDPTMRSWDMITTTNAKGEEIKKRFAYVDSDDWQESYETALKQYGEFAAENYIVFFNRIEQIRKEEGMSDEDMSESYGRVADWNPSWTLDRQTVDTIRKVFHSIRKQQSLNQGITVLESDAGVGKDVVVRIVSNLLQKKLFQFDGNKWTTERQLTHEIHLENGDSVVVPSSLVRGLETPGAIVYLNEINAMPEPVIIALHSAFDSDRAIRLKSEGGRRLKIADGVTLMGSMNPGYAGTHAIQDASASRMDMIRLGYPPLYNNEGDPSSGFNPAEGLRLARIVDSLADFTYDQDPSHNTFVKLWDNYFNGGTNTDVPTLNQQQEYDLRTIHALTLFTDKLRKAYVLRRNPDRPHNAFTIRRTMTGRELAACAFEINDMKENDRTGRTPRDAAKAFIKEALVSKIPGNYPNEIDRANKEIDSW